MIDTTNSDELTEVTYSPGELLFEEGEKSFHFFIITDGEVEVFKKNPDGHKIPLARINGVSSLGEFAMIDRKPRSASAKALTTVTATRISESAYQHLLSELPEWSVAVMRGLVDRLRQMNEIVRKHNEVDRKVVQELDAVEYENEDTLIDTSPFLRKPG